MIPMNTKIVYTFISGPDDFYLEQLMLSVLSLKEYNPSAFVEVVTDDLTEKTLTGWRAELRNMVDCITTVSVPQDYNSMKRSRFLKTNLRSMVKGNYLFIDTDTVICGSLSSIDEFKHDIMMTADCNEALELHDDVVLERCERVGFTDMSGRPYYNSGVMYVKDSAICHDLYRQWYSNWLKSVSKGVNLDQPSFNFTNHQCGDVVKEMPGEWNCQVFFNGLSCLHKSKVIHYAGGGGSERMKEIYRIIRTKGVHAKELGSFIKKPRTSFYMYLTSNDQNIKNRIMLLLNVKFNSLYRLITKFI